MPHFNVQITPLGAIIDAWVGLSQARVQALQTAKQPVPNFVQIRALVDTGASHTGMDPSVMSALGLTPTGTIQVNTPTTGNQPATANTYDVAIVIAGTTQPAHFLRTVAVSECQLLQAQGFHAIIGRDILQSFTMFYNGPGGFLSLSY